MLIEVNILAAVSPAANAFCVQFAYGMEIEVEI